jgi:hypothetical protein
MHGAAPAGAGSLLKFTVQSKNMRYKNARGKKVRYKIASWLKNARRVNARCNNARRGASL